MLRVGHWIEDHKTLGAFFGKRFTVRVPVDIKKTDVGGRPMLEFSILVSACLPWSPLMWALEANIRNCS